ncbi:AfsR/SARP family transcriptional regulator [Nonomuraea sp. KM90]|uniref:AfsR/SARP family transcriptional regulator n=1 Tax=Nonomuraea sp. KM90 TaxID=3457428 RepID=UPI003FCE1D8F
MRFHVLGPLSVTACTGEEIVIGRAKRRLLLAILLFSANKTVSLDALVDALWPDRPIHSAKADLKTHVWALRRLLSPADHARAPIVTLPTRPGVPSAAAGTGRRAWRAGRASPACARGWRPVPAPVGCRRACGTAPRRPPRCPG